MEACEHDGRTALSVACDLSWSLGPFSRDQGRSRRLLRGLSLYRLAPCRPHQDHLLEFLDGHLGDELSMDVMRALTISLAPPE